MPYWYSIDQLYLLRIAVGATHLQLEATCNLDEILSMLEQLSEPRVRQAVMDGQEAEH